MLAPTDGVAEGSMGMSVGLIGGENPRLTRSGPLLIAAALVLAVTKKVFCKSNNDAGVLKGMKKS